MTPEQFFALMAFLSVAGIVWDFWFGPTMARRGIFHAFLIALWLVTVLSIP